MDYKEQGKKNRISGQRFEQKVRKHLEEEGYTVMKHHNQINTKTGFLPAKPTFRYGRPVSLGTGFPDFIAFIPKQNVRQGIGTNYKLIFVEAKKRKYLDKEEREKGDWLIKNGYDFWIAYDKNGEVLMLNYSTYGNKTG